MKKYIPYIIVLVVGVVIGLLCRPNHDKERIVTQIDTLFRYDTIRIESPVETRYITTTETILVPITDTLVKNDTIYQVLSKEVREYKDSLYFARVSGYEPNLDFIEVYPKTMVISKTETTTKVRSNYLSLGMEMNYTDSPYIPIYLEYERMLHKNVEMSARILYDIPTQSVGFGLGVKLQVGW